MPVYVCVTFLKSSNCARDSYKRPLLPVLPLRHAVTILAQSCWNRHNFTLTKQEEERTDVDVNTVTGWWQCSRTDEYQRQVMPALQRGMMAHTVFSSIDSFFAKSSAVVVVAGCISKMTEAQGAWHLLTDSLLHGAWQASSCNWHPRGSGTPP